MAKIIEFDTKERVREATDIVDLISGYLDLRREGRGFSAICPWHDDSHPSLKINPDRQTWKCWVCNIGGDVFSFVQQREGIGFGEALRMLAEKAGIPLGDPRQAHKAAQVRDEKQAIYQVMAWAESLFHRYLLEAPQARSAREYLEGRNITQESIKTWHIGYAPDEWSWLIDEASRSKISVPTLQAGGLVSTSERTGKKLDRFRGRVIFPIRDLQQRPIAFGGRVLPEVADALEKKYSRPAAKYINSPETRVFSKSETLYGLNLARDPVSREKRLLVMEGYTDVVMARQYGVKNATAVLGTALNERHLKLIRQFDAEVVLVLDGDQAGQKRTNEILDLFGGSEVNLRILPLPDQLDPCDFLEQKGLDHFQSAVGNAVDALEHKLNVELGGIDPLRDSQRAMRAAENILKTLARAPRLTLTDSEARLKEQQIVGRLARTLAVSEPELRRRLGDLKKKRRGGPERDAENTVPAEQRGPWIPRELELLEILVLAPENVDFVMENISPQHFTEGPLRQIFNLYCECYQSGQEVDFNRIMVATEDPPTKSMLAELAESVDAKTKLDLAKITFWLQQVISSFRQVEGEQVQRQALSRLDSAQLKENEEEDILAQILEEKKREQEVQQQRLSTPWEGQ